VTASLRGGFFGFRLNIFHKLPIKFKELIFYVIIFIYLFKKVVATMKSDITLYIRNNNSSSSDVSMDAFMSAAQNLFELLKEVETTITCTKKSAIIWTISELKHGSACLGLIPNVPERIQKQTGNGKKIVSIVSQGLATLQKETLRPDDFSDNAIQIAGRLAKISTQKNVNFQIIVNDKPFYLTSQIAINAENLLATAKELGSLEGILKMVSVANNPVCTIYDRITGKGVKCKFEYQMLKTIASAIDKRVNAYGMIYYTDQGYPREITLDSIDICEPDDKFPTTDDILELDIDLTSGLSFDEFMERLHHGE
jgi:hypothetical protein